MQLIYLNKNIEKRKAFFEIESKRHFFKIQFYMIKTRTT